MIKMIRQSDGKTANVHPEEQTAYALGGYVKSDDQPKSAAPATTPGTISATAQKLIDDNGLKLEEITATGQGGSITVKDVKEAVKAKNAGATPPPPAPVAVKNEPVFIDETTKELADDVGLDASTLVGTGKDGAITTADVEKAIDETE